MATKKTFYVAAVDYVTDARLSESWLLGWDNKYDWYATDIDGDDILTPSGRIKKSNYDFIEVDRWVSALVTTEVNYCKEYSDDAIREGYDCTVCKLEKKDDEWMLIPVYKDEE